MNVTVLTASRGAAIALTIFWETFPYFTGAESDETGIKRRQT